MAIGPDVAHEFCAALVSGDQLQAELIALEAVAMGMPVADLYVDVITPALYAVGTGWERGELSVADEHLATGIVEWIMARVARSATRLPARSRERVLLAGAELEGHVVGLRMLADLVEGAGFDVRYLGAAVPVDALVDIVGRLNPRIVALSASSATPATPLVEAVEALTRMSDLDVLLGGSGVPRILREDPRIHHPGDARCALDVIERIVARDRASDAGRAGALR
jgi:methanogenic corrinoid protein MtbC1